MLTANRTLLTLLICLIAGATMPLAFAPFHWPIFAFLAPAVLLYKLLNARIKQAFFYGLAFGIGYFAVGVYWIFISVNTYGNTPFFISLIVTALLVLSLALYGAIACLLFAAISKNWPTGVRCLILFPLLWLLAELARGYLFTGFPWILLGYSQIDTPLRGFAPLISVYGLSWMTAVVSGALVLLARKENFWLQICSGFTIFILVIIGWSLNRIDWTQPVGKPMTVSLVQGNIGQSIKWNSAYILHTLKEYRTLTNKNWGSKLIVWPEAAVPVLASEVTPYIDLMNREAKNHDDYLIMGIPLDNVKTQKYYNGLLLLGKGKGSYRKRHLVPFGEYFPLRSLFGWFYKDFKVPMSSFSPGPEKQPLLTIEQFKVAPFICYEIAYPFEVLSNSKHANIIVTITDDSWFSKSIALAQHLQMAQMRALESGKPVLLASNTGYTAIINNHGKIIAQAPPGKVSVLTHDIQAFQGNTPIQDFLN